MTARQRVLAAVAGQEAAVDRPPIALWGHFYDGEADPAVHVAAHLAYQRRWNWDIVKVQPRASYYAEDWGVRWRYPDGHEVGGLDRADRAPAPLPAALPTYTPGTHQWVKPALLASPVTTPADWRTLTPRDPRLGALGEHLQSLRRIVDGVGPDVPVIQTVFDPISVAWQIAGERPEVVLQAMREDPAALHAGLQTIATTFANYAAQCIEAGAAGIFLATTLFASYHMLDDAAWAEFGRPYDRQVLDAVADAPLNVLHICADRAMVAPLLDMPHVAAINWDAHAPGNPSFLDVRALTNRALLGGIGHDSTLDRGTPTMVAGEVAMIRALTGDRRVILGPGCSVNIPVPDANVAAARAAVG